MIAERPSTALLVFAGGLATAGCCHNAEPDPAQSVTIEVAAMPATGARLTIQSLRIVAGHAAFDDPIGCADCQTGWTGPRLVSVPLDGTPVPVGEEQASAGHYTALEVGLATPDSAIVSATPGWPERVTLAIEGTFDGAAFALRCSIQGTAHQDLAAPLDLPTAESQTQLAVTLTLPVDAWFRVGDTWLDPGDPAQRALIEANVQRAFQPQVSP